MMACVGSFDWGTQRRGRAPPSSRREEAKERDNTQTHSTREATETTSEKAVR